MRRRAKTIVIILLALGLLLTVFAAGSSWLFLNSISRLETELMLTEVKRGYESIQTEIDHIETITGDYSGWDEAYLFVQNGNHPFITSNLADPVFSKMRLNLIAYFNSAGKMVFGKQYDHRNNRNLPIPASLASHLTPKAPLLTHPSINSVIKGFLATQEGILMVASRPVLTSQYKGPAKGTIIMARYLDASEIQAIAKRTRRSLSILPLDSPEHSRIKVLNNSPLDVHIETTNETIKGYSHINDIYGKEIFLLRVETPRSLFQQGQKAIGIFLALFTAVVMLSTGGTCHIFERLTSSLKRQQEAEKHYRTLVGKAAEGIILVTHEGYFILEANAAFASFIGMTVQEILGCSLLDYLDSKNEECIAELTRILDETRELEFRHRSGHTIFAEVNGSSLTYQEQAVLSLIIHDVTERKNFEEQLMYQAGHDPLTGLPNRNLLNDRMTQAIAISERTRQSIVLILFDLDHFKVINDSMGHSYGDQLLITVARRLQELIRGSDTVSRIGGDEFVAVITTSNRSETVITVANRFLAAISRPFTLQGQEIHLTASIGIAQYPEDGEDFETLFKKADTAMYHIKEHGRNGIQFFAEEMNRKISKRMKIESQLRYALERNEFHLHYQPQIELSSGKIVGMEVLLRWHNNELGLVSPEDFIPVAEDTGIIIAMGEWALRTACVQYRIWTEQNFPKLRMAVNLSPRQFGHHNLVEMVRSTLNETGIDPSCLDLEVTESLMMNNIEDSIKKMVALRQLGLSLSIDDFGTGYSSLSSLQRFPLNILKVDRSFVQEIGNGSKSVIIRAIVAMAHSLGLSVIAEGVETVEQLNFLRSHHCEEVQGYYFSRPLSSDKFGELITTFDSGNPTLFEPQRTSIPAL
jgi:diguanylate cyclase (GGDEF)-like protein/PAS domain S-box-containing protein